MPNIIGYKDLSNLYIKPAAEPTRTTLDINLKSASEPERVLNPIVSESYMRQYIEEHGGITPTGNIVITENTTEPLDIAQYATATVTVDGGGTELLHCVATIVNNTGETLAFNTNVTPVLSTDGKCLDDPTALASLANNRTAEIDALYRVAPNDMIAFGLTEMNEFLGKILTPTASNAVNCSLMSRGNEVIVILTNAENPSSITITYTLEDAPH